MNRTSRPGGLLCAGVVAALLLLIAVTQRWSNTDAASLQGGLSRPAGAGGMLAAARPSQRMHEFHAAVEEAPPTPRHTQQAPLLSSLQASPAAPIASPSPPPSAPPSLSLVYARWTVGAHAIGWQQGWDKGVEDVAVQEACIRPPPFGTQCTMHMSEALWSCMVQGDASCDALVCPDPSPYRPYAPGPTGPGAPYRGMHGPVCQARRVGGPQAWLGLAPAPYPHTALEADHAMCTPGGCTSLFLSGWTWADLSGEGQSGLQELLREEEEAKGRPLQQHSRLLLLPDDGMPAAVELDLGLHVQRLAPHSRYSYMGTLTHHSAASSSSSSSSSASLWLLSPSSPARQAFTMGLGAGNGTAAAGAGWMARIPAAVRVYLVLP